MISEALHSMCDGTFIFLLVACFLASFIDAVSGGGGLISLPAYMASGIPPHMALGTNKVSACIATCASSAKFASSGKINWTLMRKIAIFSLIGAFLGVRTILLVSSKYLYPMTVVLLLVVLGYTLMNKKMGEVHEFDELTDKTILYGRIMAFVIGFYDGFFGPGTGSFLIFGLIRIFKMDFPHASGNAKILNLTSNIASVIMFVYFKQVNYLYSVPVGIVMMLGAFLGARTAVTKGTKFIKPMFLTVTSVVLLKMIAEAVFHVDVSALIQNFISSLVS
ncbi:putative membrane transporter protein YfcA [Fusobacterium sp. DD29]|uniref:sulfite exporter TauE/SafE family protein n=1 Tax=unclassified Fusobacterium TaxID=2648384 RepID=UPI001B8C854D|nr:MULTISPECIES: TSUP family transporter [unclassified Fusobacterium]MBR8702012.1 putative membrane transporter protein YfcA [Fusobacterium sp. DD45]MBR8711813.1 putative membrane transporter protein YfcA [Fusobacterium sp. DD28]MBR8750234.1 putative membrane transporter protein YfcA [Fusobacterium sp. DD29]MBR8752375.1 putative membrane transporter protein YfcA [Fusobacterium sp. DD26]MBR8762481.1 putative membrane transporter protein YfcA [Fusobacterium sp. DD25]